MGLFQRNRLSGVKPGWHAANFFTKFDLFDQLGIPGFNLKGVESIATPAGGFCSVILIILMVMFGWHKAVMLYNRLNPVVNEVTMPDAIDEEEVINLGESEFRFTFSIEKGFATQTMNDSAFMKWRVRHYGIKDGVKFQNMLPVHKCTEDDMSQFYPVSTPWKRSYEKRSVDGLF